MALVTLKRNWFAPGGLYFRTRNNPVDVPEELLEQLPSDAVPVEDAPKAAAPKAPPADKK